jgi:ADP-glucose pyrophosphorylase
VTYNFDRYLADVELLDLMAPFIYYLLKNMNIFVSVNKKPSILTKLNESAPAQNLSKGIIT